MLVATLTISGIPPFAGFFSKDEILWKAWSNGHPVVWLLLWLGAGMTAFYMFRLMFLTFFGSERMDDHTRHHLQESPKRVVYPLAVLAGLSVVGGWIGMPAWTGIANKFEHFLEPVLWLPEDTAHPAHAAHSTSQELILTGLSIAVVFVGIYFAHRFYVARPGTADRITAKIRGIYQLVYRKYLIDELYDALLVNRTKNLGNACFFFDSKFIDGLLVNGSASVTRGISTISKWFDSFVVDGLVNLIGWINMQVNRLLTTFQTGLVQRYALIAVFGIIVLILVYYKGLLIF
jgi:NADH-quinone oxidoreductase subunit L